MELYYIFGAITLTLSVLIGLRLRKAGKEIENKNLTDAGNYWLIINGISILLTIIMLSKAGLLNFKSKDICECLKDAKDEAGAKACFDESISSEAMMKKVMECAESEMKKAK